MPHVQVLPYIPSFGERLTESLAQSGSQVAEAFMQRQAQRDLDRLLKEQEKPDFRFPMQQVNEQINQNSNTANASALSPLKLGKIYDLAARARGKDFANNLAKGYLEQQKLQESEAQTIRAENRKRQSEFFSKQQQENIGQRERLRKEKNDLKLGLQAVQEGNVGGFDKNYVASLFGSRGEPLKTAKGVQLESTMKNLLIDSLQKTAGRPNQWIEQQIKSATASIGKSREANETLLEMGLANNDIEEKLLDTRDELVAAYEKNGVIPPSDLDKIVHDIVKPYAEQREAKLAYDLRVLYEREQGPRSLISLQKVRPGTPLTRERAQALLKKYGSEEEVIKKAKQLGYAIPSSAIIDGPPIEPEIINE